MPPVDPNNSPERKRQRALEHKEHVLENTKGSVSLGNTALRSAILLNGAAAAALLAFVSQRWVPGVKLSGQLEMIIFSLKDLVLGAFAGVVATGFGYLRMYFEGLYYIADIDGKSYAHRWVSVANVMLWIAIILVIYSYWRFGIAMWRSFSALLGN